MQMQSRGWQVYLMVSNHHHGTKALYTAGFGALVGAVHINKLHGVRLRLLSKLSCV